MITDEQKLRESLLKFINNGKMEFTSHVAKIVGVNKDENTCDVILVKDDIELFDVRLIPNIESVDGKFQYPKIDSFVIVTFLSKSDAFITSVSELDEFYLKIVDTEYRVDKDGFLIKKGDESLLKILEDLLTAVENMIFTSPQGPTGKAPINIAEFKAIKQRLPNLFKK